MSIAKSILDAVQISREASAKMLEHYYEEGVISRVDLEDYADYLRKINDDLEYRLQSMFGVCESRLQVKKGKK
jgi:PhoPQ-activated pathogenicity-related protein